MNLVWIRRDLRLHDHAALSAATQDNDECVLVFVFDPLILKSIQNKKSHHVQFMHSSLMELDARLQKLQQRLVILFGDPQVEIPKFCKTNKIGKIFFNRDYEPYALKRDESIENTLTKAGVVVRTFKDHMILEPHEVLKADGDPYKVFTPYKNAWLKCLKPNLVVDHLVRLKKITTPKGVKTLDDYQLNDLGFEEVDLGDFEPGTEGAKKIATRLKLSKYKDQRDRPDLPGTSLISPHLRFGTLSIRQAFHISRRHRDVGHETWLNELIWREFYQMIIFQYPKAEKESFQPQYRDLKWPGSTSFLKKWQAGLTGYPIVDAGMRQLLQTGWMHNRVRMIVASFLTRDLLVNWQLGEDWFREHLIDYELASNNGGWQWAASTGCDAQPYFRIFNPTLQSERFDPEGLYIKKYVPELKMFEPKFIHAPWLCDMNTMKKFSCIVGKDYPEPIVDHASQKPKAISLFKK